MATTFNEANIQLLLQVMPQFAAVVPFAKPMIRAAATATGSPAFSSLLFSNPVLTTPVLLDAHRKGYRAIKASRPSLPVGVTLTTQDVQGPPDLVAGLQARL